MPTTREVLVQSLIAFAVLFVLARLMGKRQVTQLTFFDYIVGITIGNIAAAWSVDDVRSLHAMASLLVWALLPLGLAFLQRKSYWARILLDGRPLVLIQNGKVLEDNVKKAGLEIEEMMLLLRGQNVFKLSDVEYAIFETNGKLSVMKKSDLQPVTPKDAEISVNLEHEPHLLIIDGKVMQRTLETLGYTKEWLHGEIMKQGANDFDDVFVAQVDSDGKVYVDVYEDSLKMEEVKQKPLLAANLKKIQAEFESFALQTHNEEAKELYAKSATTLKRLLGQIKPYLRE